MQAAAREAIYAPEHSTRAGALELARRLREYWGARGLIVTIEVERRTASAWNPDTTEDSIWGLKSDIGSWAA